MPSERIPGKEHIITSVVIPIENASPESNHRETLDKPQVSDIPQNDWFVAFKNVKVMKDKERLRSCSRFKETKET